MTQKILIVDDMQANLNELSQALKSQEHDIFVATHGRSALEVARSEIPDLILLDIAMPEMDGYAVCSQLKKDGITRNIPVIFLKERESEEDEAKGLELGAVDYISKPCRPPLVKARVKTYLELKRQYDIVENISEIDGLTGVSNRRHFDQVLEQEWRRAIRGFSRLSLIIIDIDYFRLFNENYGCTAGDDCLKQVAQALNQKAKRSTDLLARYQGEQFACLLPLTEAKGAFVMANKLRDCIISLNMPHGYSAVADHVTISQGIATLLPYPHSEATKLIVSAEKALELAKLEGRNQISFVD
ncbi:MAG: diguanylate cyclase response regulator [Candidatus Parabeggiatoa sp. nov. 3]|nr:MAG: diguanylate cyclase response regulator [Gammaproteobacteria bacterium]RKZ67111.1 MAG: diguanylate cyclase response regulator [Gammaproteobacteria bacterium]RKZ88377.1 MAG: diguanylate cyclase response regulator [Gammaproteobacteria bacterium]